MLFRLCPFSVSLFVYSRSWYPFLVLCAFGCKHQEMSQADLLVAKEQLHVFEQANEELKQIITRGEHRFAVLKAKYSKLKREYRRNQ